jgi:hypothetical protein
VVFGNPYASQSMSVVTLVTALAEIGVQVWPGINVADGVILGVTLGVSLGVTDGVILGVGVIDGVTVGVGDADTHIPPFEYSPFT